MIINKAFSLSAKPIIELIGPLEFQATHKIFEISGTENYGEGVRVAAVVSEVRVIVTKNSGAEMAFVKVDDGTGVIELVIFPKIFRDTRDFWVEGKPILVYGKVDSRGDNTSLIVESIETLDSLGEKKEREVFIKIPKGTPSEVLKNLKSLFTQNLGDHTATLIFEGGKKIKLPFKIAWTETLAKQILDAIEVKDDFRVQ